MTTLSDKQNQGLPPPPAPPRRSANPWRLSDTARKPESRPQSTGTDLLGELIRQAPADEHVEEHQAPREPGAKRSPPALVGLVIFGVIVLIAVRVFLGARKDGDWMKLIGPLIFIAIIAHGLWRSRRRREARKTKPDQA